MLESADRVQVGDRAVGEQDLRARVALEQARQVARQRRHGAAGMEEHRHAPLGRQREGGVEGGMREVESGQARVQLDAARARVERCGELRQEALTRLAAAEGDDAAAAVRRGLEHAGIGRRVATAGRRLEGKGAGARDLAAVHRREQRGEIEARAVACILAQMGMDVDEPALRRHQRAHLCSPDALERCGGVCEFSGHGAPS
jgi:hypothetical protein